MSTWVILALLIAVVALCWELYKEIKIADVLREQVDRLLVQGPHQTARVAVYIAEVSGLLCTLGNTPATWTGTAFRCSGCGAMARDPVNLAHTTDCVIGRCERLGIEGRYLVDR